MKRILIMAVLVGLGIFLSLQVAQARGDDISISEDDKMYMTPEQISSYESGSTQADVQSVSEPSSSYEARTDYSQPDISSGGYDYSPADTGAVDNYQPDMSDNYQSSDSGATVTITDNLTGTTEVVPMVVISAEKDNGSRIQDILDSRAQARESGTDWSQSWAQERGFANDNVISEPVQYSAPVISEPVIVEAPVIQPSYDAGASARDAQDRADLDAASAAFDRTSAWLEGRGSRLW